MKPDTLDGYFKIVRYELIELVNLAVWRVEPWPFKVLAEVTFRNAVLVGCQETKHRK
jgi:hypothetical protein